MQRIKFVSLSLILGIVFSISLSAYSHSADETVNKTGNIVCLLPDYESGNVKPVIASGPCNSYPPHNHLLVTKDAVYSIQGLQDGLEKMELSSHRNDVTVAGKVQGSEQTGWVLFVN